MTGLTEVPRVGSQVKVQFGRHIMDGTVLTVNGTLIRVRLHIEGSDEPYDGLYRLNELLAA